MTSLPARITAATALFTLIAGVAGCAAGADPSARTTGTETTEVSTDVAERAPGGGTREPTRTKDEQLFLDELAGFGLSTEMTAATTVEVGIGICQGIADGADDEMILDRIRPLTTALAAHDGEHDTAEVGRAIVDASRTHLCD